MKGERFVSTSTAAPEHAKKYLGDLYTRDLYKNKRGSQSPSFTHFANSTDLSPISSNENIYTIHYDTPTTELSAEQNNGAIESGQLVDG